MSHKYLLGIDVGTSSLKTTIVTSEGELKGAASNEYPTYYAKPGWAEQNPEDWYSAFKVTLAKAIKQADISGNNIYAIGVTGQMIGLTCLDKQKNVLRPTILWMDQRNIAQVNWLKENFGDMIRTIAYTPLNTAFTLPKILWVKKYEPEIWRKIYKIQLPKDYIRLKLTDVWATDYNDASGTLLFEVLNRRWSEEISKHTGVSMDKLPRVFPSTEVVGYITQKASMETGLAAGTPVVAGAGDLATENFAAGVIETNQRLIRLGTSAVISTAVSKPILDPNEKCPCYVHCIPNKWSIEASTQSFGLSERWFRDIFCDEEMAKAQKLHKSAYELIDEIAAKVSPGADGLFFHPFITGAPYWDPYLRGAFIGITLQHNKGHFARAVLEGSVYSLKDSLRSLKSLIENEVTDYVVVGGGSKSRLWCQIVSDIIGVDVFLPETSGASIGAAMLAGVGTLVFKDFGDAIRKYRKKGIKLQCNKENHKKYNSLFEVYKEIHRSLTGTCKTIHRVVKSLT